MLFIPHKLSASIVYIPAVMSVTLLFYLNIFVHLYFKIKVLNLYEGCKLSFFYLMDTVGSFKLKCSLHRLSVASKTVCLCVH